MESAKYNHSTFLRHVGLRGCKVYVIFLLIFICEDDWKSSNQMYQSHIFFHKRAHPDWYLPDPYPTLEKKAGSGLIWYSPMLFFLLIIFKIHFFTFWSIVNNYRLLATILEELWIRLSRSRCSDWILKRIHDPQEKPGTYPNVVFQKPDPGPQLWPGRLPYPVERVASMVLILYVNSEISAHV